jgi:hypothetical protein
MARKPSRRTETSDVKRIRVGRDVVVTTAGSEVPESEDIVEYVVHDGDGVGVDVGGGVVDGICPDVVVDGAIGGGVVDGICLDVVVDGTVGRGVVDGICLADVVGRGVVVPLIAAVVVGPVAAAVVVLVVHVGKAVMSPVTTSAYFCVPRLTECPLTCTVYTPLAGDSNVNCSALFKRSGTGFPLASVNPFPY